MQRFLCGNRLSLVVLMGIWKGCNVGRSDVEVGRLSRRFGIEAERRAP